MRQTVHSYLKAADGAVSSKEEGEGESGPRIRFGINVWHVLFDHDTFKSGPEFSVNVSVPFQTPYSSLQPHIFP